MTSVPTTSTRHKIRFRFSLEAKGALAELGWDAISQNRVFCEYLSTGESEQPITPQLREVTVVRWLASGRELYLVSMRQMLRFLWNSTRGHRIAPWRSPYLLWRIETFTGVKMTQIGFLEFWEFLWTERHSLWRFLKWTGEMDRYVHPKAKSL